MLLSQKTEVTKIEKKLTSREREFCSCFLNTGSSSLAAQRAGWLKNPEQAGEKLLCRKEIADEIEALARQREKSLANMASVGYQRLAISGWLSVILPMRFHCFIWKIRHVRI